MFNVCVYYKMKIKYKLNKILKKLIILFLTQGNANVANAVDTNKTYILIS